MRWWESLVFCIHCCLGCDITGSWYEEHFAKLNITANAGGAVKILSLQPTKSLWTNGQAVITNQSFISASFYNISAPNATGWIAKDCRTIFWNGQWGDSLTRNWYRDVPDVSTVHVIYMTHIDVGYTQPLSTSVFENYISTEYPQVVTTAADLRKAGGEESFIWTTHPYIVQQLLSFGNPDQIASFEASVARGEIQWHGGPGFNIQSEVCEATLFDYGLSIAQTLSTRFNRSFPIAASQKDVPGITRATIKHFAKNGIQALHVGVNDFSNPPSVPETQPEQYGISEPFVWRDEESGSEMIGMWNSGYSRWAWGISPELMQRAPGHDHALVFLMRVDNSGPQTADDVKLGWSNIKSVFPNAKLFASSLDQYTQEVLKVKASLKVVTQEIGDTWIRGVASDPWKTRSFREVSRQRAQALAEGRIRMSDPRVELFSRYLLKIPEHTWGFNEGQLMMQPWDNTWFDAHVLGPSVQENKASFLEQRMYINNAIEALGTLPLRDSINKALDQLVPSIPDISGLTPFSLSSQPQCGGFTLQFDNRGSIISLKTTQSNVSYADTAHSLGLFHYTTHTEEEFQAYLLKTMIQQCTTDCAGCGFSKCNLKAAQPEAKDWMPVVKKSYSNCSSSLSLPQDACRFVFELSLDAGAQTKYGAPEDVWVDVTVSSAGVWFDLQWFNKRPTRMAEALWFSFNPVVSGGSWQVHKIDQWIDVFDVVVNGSRARHSIWDGIRYNSTTQSSIFVQSLDTPIVSVGDASPIAFYVNDEQPPVSNGMHFNLFNNAWSTNYPEWTLDKEDRFRFFLALKSH